MYAFIMAGGVGSRFWPLSREVTPKQLLRITGPRTMIQQTVSRLNKVINSDDIFIITNSKQHDEIARQLEADYKNIRDNIIVEPCGRDTAAAVGLAATYISTLDPDAIMGMFPADHVIGDEKRFLKLIALAEEVAAAGKLVTLGIKMTKPDTGYGYIKKGESIKSMEDVTIEDAELFYIDRFIEKPDIQTAKKFLKVKENYFWNSGMFFWKASRILDEIKSALPELYDGLEEIRQALVKGKDHFKETIAKIYPGLKKISIDKGIMESASGVVVIPAEIAWSDVGSWAALGDIMEKDKDGNIIEGNIINHGCKNSILIGCSRVMATIGLKDMVVVDTPDATMLCSKENAQNVKNVVEILQKRGADECIEHLTVERNWGSYTILGSADRFKIKKICVKPGARLSSQYHHHRSEHWVVVQGTAKVTRDGKTFTLHENESTYIPMSTTHRLENPGIIPLHIIEVQNGSYLGEDDIVRLEDDYGRV